MVGPRLDAQGGIAAVARVLAQSRLKDDYELEYLGLSGNGSLLVRLGQSSLGLARALFAIAGYPRALVHLHVASRGSFWRKSVLGAWARLLGRRTVVHLHGALFHQFAAEGSLVRRSAVARMFGDADAVIVLSQSWTERVREFSQPSSLVVIPNPVGIPAQTADRNAHAILFAGRLGERKGVATLVEAFADVCVGFPQWRLVLCGDGPDAPIAAVAQRRGIAGCVDLLGWQNPSQLARIRETSSVFCLPSHDEGLPVALLEAMAAGMCCVVSPVGGIPEHVIDGVSGRLVRPGDRADLGQALRAVMLDASERVRLGDAARLHVSEECSTDAVTLKIEAVYAGLEWPPRSGTE